MSTHSLASTEFLGRTEKGDTMNKLVLYDQRYIDMHSAWPYDFLGCECSYWHVQLPHRQDPI